MCPPGMSMIRGKTVGSTLKRTVGVLAGAVALAVTTGTAPAFASATGCHSSACVKVEGSGLHVDWIQAYSGDEVFHGRFKIYAEKMGYVKYTPLTTYYNNGDHTTFYREEINKYWKDGTDICVQALRDGTHDAGTACETVEK